MLSETWQTSYNPSTMSRFRMNKEEFAKTLGLAADRIRGNVMHVGKQEGDLILKDIFGRVPAAKGKVALAKIALTTNPGDYKKLFQQKMAMVRANGEKAMRASYQRMTRALETVKLRKAYHQFILKDQKQTLKGDLKSFVAERWWIPQEFAVTRHHGLGSYVFLVSINIGISVGEAVLGAKALQWLGKIRTVRQVYATVFRSKKLRDAARTAARIGRPAVQRKVEESNLVEKVDAKIRNVFEQGAIKLFDAVQTQMDKPVKI